MHKLSLFSCALLLVVSLVVACGGGGASDEPPLPEGPGGGGPTFDMSKANATITGKISFEGTPPPNEKVQMSSDPYCNTRAKEYPTLETYMVKDGGLDNVILYIANAPAATYATPAPADVDQQNCHYIPHVFTLMTNQTVRIKNSDMTLHNINASAMKNRPFNVGQPAAGLVNETKFEVPEFPLPVRCDVHRWMGAFIGVFDHPFHTVSKNGGTFELKLPPGKYEIIAWHEKLGQKMMSVEVADNEKKEVNFSFSAGDKAAD